MSAMLSVQAIREVTVTVAFLSEELTAIVTLVWPLFLMEPNVVKTIAQFIELMIAHETSQNLVHSIRLTVAMKISDEQLIGTFDGLALVSATLLIISDGSLQKLSKRCAFIFFTFVIAHGHSHLIELWQNRLVLVIVNLLLH